MKSVVIADGDRIIGVDRPLAWVGREAQTGTTWSDLASGKFVVVRERDVFFNVIRRMWRRQAEIAVVVHDRGGPRPDNVAGVITKELVADSAANSIVVFPTRT